MTKRERRYRGKGLTTIDHRPEGEVIEGTSQDPVDFMGDETDISADDTINWFYAKFPGKCKACSTPFLLNSIIGYVDGDLVGQSCCNGMSVPLKQVMPHGKSTKDYCSKCFIVHSTLQTECE